jgi:hypothetical protein
MLCMRDLDAQLKVTFRSTHETYDALSRLVLSLRSAPDVSFRGKRVTQEGVINAAILLLRDMDEGEFKRAMAAHLVELEAILSDDPPESRDLTGHAQNLIRDANRPKKAPPCRDGPLITDVDNLTPRRPGDRRGKKGA